jgi:2-succinyl-5-enolpyruvyl-6-hydroxy-3-cyclohexene-1-carboxylate synthase
VFEDLFGTPHGLEFGPAAEMYGLDYTVATTPAEYEAAVRASVAKQGVSIVEVRTERDANLKAHGEVWSLVRQALAEARG